MSTSYSRPTTALYGLTSLPADQSKTPPSTSSPATVRVSDLKLPQTPLATRIAAYAKSKLDAKTFNHSLRVYSYGCAIARQCFPQFQLTEGSTLEETWFLCAMLHDIGTPVGILESTRLSFEFWGGYHALHILRDSTLPDGAERDSEAEAPIEQAESVCEAIIRHQDVQEKGNLTLLTRLIHLGTLLDNIGAGAELVNAGTISEVNKAYDRQGWSGCFKETLERELEHKPYAMVSRIEGFGEAIMKNAAKGGLMEAYD